jgi:DNA-binding transcriptional LysR family regulator
VTPREMAEYGFIGGLGTSNFNKLLIIMLRRAGIRQPQIIMEVQDPRSVNELARHGIGVAGSLISRTSNLLNDGSLVPVRLDAPPAFLEVRWAYSSRQPIPKNAIELLRHVKRRRVYDAASPWLPSH